ncbi:MAG: winged helix DNA-binding protein [Alphaproteobacteria bacterium]|nr:winged helix DNA-binding protein [Alphaproteobacteria bacterium]
MSLAFDMGRHAAPEAEESFEGEYLQALRLIERLHRLLLDVIKDEFDRRGGSELNPVQALLLHNIGDSELTAGELKTRGYYLGSNVSYNLKKLVDMGYIHYKRSETDRRSVRVSLTDKGHDACEVIRGLHERQLVSLDAVGEVGQDDLNGLNRSLVRLERFWTDQIRYRL